MSEEMEKVIAAETAPVTTLKKLLDAGCHFGHQTKRWDPKMKNYIYTSRSGIYIIDLVKTVELVDVAYKAMRQLIAENGKVLFVCTKKPNDDIIREEALRCGSFYVTSRWLGGTLTNFKTIQKRIKYLAELRQLVDSGNIDNLTKKEATKIKKEMNKLETNLGGIKEMKKLPNAIFVVDPNGEEIAVKEAKKLKIKVFALCDTNTNPTVADYVIPCNDDSQKAVRLISQLMADAVLESRGGDLAVAYVKDEEGPEVTMVDALKNVEISEEKKQYHNRFNKDYKRRPAREYRPEVKTENKEEAKPVTENTEVKPEVKVEATPEVKSEVKEESAAEVKKVAKPRVKKEKTEETK